MTPKKQIRIKRKEAREIINELFKPEEKEMDFKDMLREEIVEAFIKNGLDQHYLAGISVGKKNRPLTLEFSSQLFKEYQCEKPSEKALAQIVVSAFGRILECSEMFKNCKDMKSFSKIGREIDRANRQFIFSLAALKKFSSDKNESSKK